MWPASTVAPNGSPANALPSHQPICEMSRGICSVPSTVRSTTTGALPCPGISTEVGTKRIRVDGAAVPVRAGAATVGAGAAARSAEPELLSAGVGRVVVPVVRVAVSSRG